MLQPMPGHGHAWSLLLTAALTMPTGLPCASLGLGSIVDARLAEGTLQALQAGPFVGEPANPSHSPT